MVLNGLDPKDERDKTRAAAISLRAHQITFDDAIDQCMTAKVSEWKNFKHGQQWRNTLVTYASPVLGQISVDLITTELVHKVLQPIWHTKTETATRVRQRIESVLDWCKARGYCHGDNPARLKGALGELLPKSQKIAHHPAIPYGEINAFVTELRKQRGYAPLALEFMLLTASRTGEVVAAQWDEIDWSTKVWTVPAIRMKAGKEHRIPLSTRAVEILQIMKTVQQNEYIFHGHSVTKNSHMSSGTCRIVMKRMLSFSQYTPHGLRSTFRDWAAETTNFANETLELALAHRISNKAEAAYRRQDQLEKRAKLMQQWHQFVDTQFTNTRLLKFERFSNVKKMQLLDLTSKEPLIERQRKLWQIAEAIELAAYRKQPLDYELSKWLWLALQKICRGENSNEALDVVAKKGERKDGFRQEMNKKMVMAAIAASTQSEASKKTKVAIEEVSNALPLIKKTTARKTWNIKSTERKPHFSFGKK
jgi:integrase